MNLTNKKAIGFGRLLAVMTFVLFGLMIWFFTIANQKVEASIGTEELKDIDSKNLEFYFSDSTGLGFNRAISEVSSDSFIDKNTLGCSLNQDNIFILKEECKPNPDLIKILLETKISDYVKESLKKYPLKNRGKKEIELSCKIEKQDDKDIIKCQSDKIKLNSSRKNSFMSYVLEYEFILNSIEIIDKIEIDEIEQIYAWASRCDADCQLDSDHWILDKIEKKDSYLIFSLTSKKNLFLDKTGKIEPIKWVFAIEKKT